MGFVVSIILARLLEPSDFGTVAMVMAIVGIAGIFGDVGLGSALIQRRRVMPIHYSSVFYFNIIVGFFLTLITFSIAPYIGGFYNNMELVTIAQVLSFSFIIGAFSSLQNTKLRKELNYALLTKLQVVSSAVSGILGISMAFYGAGAWSLVAQSLVQGIIYNLMIWTVSQWKPKAEFSLRALKQLWAFGFRMFLSSLLDTIFGRLDTIIIGKLFTPATLGYFNRAKALDQLVISYSSSSLLSVLFPLLSKVKNDLPRFRSIVKKAFGLILFVTFFLVGELYLVSHEVIVLLFGEKWLQSVEYFKILALAGFGYPVSALLVNIISSRGNSKVFLRLEIFKKILFGGNLSIGFIWGVEGYLYGLIIVMFLAVYMNIYFASKEIDMSQAEFIVPVVIQAMLTALIVMVFVFINKGLGLPLFFMLLIKGGEFAVAYFLINKILNTYAHRFFWDEAKPIVLKLFNRVKR